jgi:hypothetical protein
VGARLVQEQQVLAVDIMFIQKVPFLLGILLPLGLLLVSHLKSKAASSIKTVLETFLGKAKRRNFDVQIIQADGETGIKPLITGVEIAGVTIETSGLGQHVAQIERSIQTVKGRFRAHRNDLPFVLCTSLIILCVMFCVSKINLVPTEGSGVRACPMEKYSGRKPDADLDLRFPLAHMFRRLFQ